MGLIRIDMSNTNNKWVEFGLTNVDTFIIGIGFELANVNMIRILTRHEHNPLTRIVTVNKSDIGRKSSKNIHGFSQKCN